MENQPDLSETAITTCVVALDNAIADLQDYTVQNKIPKNSQEYINLNLMKSAKHRFENHDPGIFLNEIRITYSSLVYAKRLINDYIVNAASSQEAAEAKSYRRKINEAMRMLRIKILKV